MMPALPSAKVTHSVLHKFSVWRHYMEQWDANDISPPDMVVEAHTATDAAIRFAEAKFSSDSESAVIVRDEADGQYYEIELTLSWDFDHYKKTTLEELCKP